MRNTYVKNAGCLFGLALGDALAFPTEFIRRIEEIEERFGPGGPREPIGNPALVTDDTQMTLAVGEALLKATRPYTAQTVEGPLREAFIAWMISPDNTRAPGMTCMSACRRLMSPNTRWQEATVINSKGCGANMRVAPIGLLPNVDDTMRAALAQFQAALTHGHPTGLAASDLTAFAIADLVAGGELGTLLARLRAYAKEQRTIYHSDWLGNLWEQFGASPETYIARGWDECLETLGHLEKAVADGNRETDPCLATGAGWIAEEAFATGMLCFLLFPDDPIAALRRAALTSGDSDSIACLTGAFAGAYHGISAWPPDWIARIEYHDRLEKLAVGFTEK